MLQGGNAVYTSNDWKWCNTHVYTGSAWKRAVPYVYTNGAWQITGGAGTNIVYFLVSNGDYFTDSTKGYFLVR